MAGSNHPLRLPELDLPPLTRSQRTARWMLSTQTKGFKHLSFKKGLQFQIALGGIISLKFSVLSY